MEELKKNPFVLAPMAGITDCAFRSFMREMGAGIVITELVSATGLKFSSEKTRKLMRFEPIQHPVGIQIFGDDLEALSYAAKEVEQLGADFVDINFGCPVPKVVKKGAGSAALKDLSFLTKVLRAVKGAVDIPVTIKVRTGWDNNTKNTHEVAKIAYNEGILWMAIHGRTRAQGYTGLSDWDYIREVKSVSKIPIIGNGDITSAQIAKDRLVSSACDAVMIGRGCLKNPWIFQEAKSLHAAQSAEAMIRDFVTLFGRLKEHLQNSHEERMVALQLKKLAAWYSSGYPGSSLFRKSIFSKSSLGDVVLEIENYFFQLRDCERQDTSGESFLMGGHG